MRRVTSFCVLLASSLLLLLHGACSEHAFCRNAREIPRETERDAGKSVQIFDQINGLESKNISTVALVSKETKECQTPPNFLESEKWIDSAFLKLTKINEDDKAKIVQVEIIKNTPKTTHTHSRMQSSKLRSSVTKVRGQGRLSTRSGRRSRLRTHQRKLRRVVLIKKRLRNSEVRRQVSRRRRAVIEKRSLQRRILSKRKRERTSSYRRTVDRGQQARFRRVSGRRSRKITDHRRARPLSFRRRVTSQTMQSSRSGGKAILHASRIRYRRSFRTNATRHSQRRVRRSLVSNRKIDVYVRSTARLSRRLFRNLRMRRLERRTRNSMQYRQNKMAARRNRSLYRRSRRHTRTNWRFVRIETTSNHRSSSRRLSRLNRVRLSRESQNFGRQRTIGHYRRSTTRSLRRYRRASNREVSRFSNRLAGRQRRIRRRRSRQVSRSRTNYIQGRIYFDKRGTIGKIYHDGNFSSLIPGYHNKSAVPSYELLSIGLENVLQMSSMKDEIPSFGIETLDHTTKKSFATTTLTGKTNGKHLFPFDPFQFSKVVITAVGFILGTRVKHV